MEIRTTAAKERIDIIYLVRAVAILGIIVVHVTSVPLGEIADTSSSMFRNFNFLNVFHKFGTPTFVFLSAFVLFYNYYDRPLKGGLVFRFFQRRFLYILVPYLISSTYYYCIQIYYSYGESPEGFFENASWSSFASMVLQGQAFYHLYFVFISVQFYVVFPLLLWLFQRWSKLTKHLIWIGFALQWVFVVCNEYVLHYDNKGQLAISYVAFYLLGAYAGIHYERIKGWLTFDAEAPQVARRALLWTAWALFSLGDVYLWYKTRTSDFSAHVLLYEALWFAHAFASCIVLMQISGWIYRTFQAKVVNAFIHLGVASFGVYIIHAAVLFYYFRLPASYNPLYYYLYVFVGYLVTLLVSWMIVGLLQKYVKLSWVLFGALPKQNPYLPARPRPALETGRALAK